MPVILQDVQSSLQGTQASVNSGLTGPCTRCKTPCMPFMTLSPDECGMESHAAPDEAPVRSANHRVDFRLIYVEIRVAGCKMSWTAGADDDHRGDSQPCLAG